MSKYRRKSPHIIEAFQWTGGKDQTEDPAWICEAIKEGRVRVKYPHLEIDTDVGMMIADVGDYILCGYEGEIIRCSPNLFLELFEKVV